ncbi:sulfotransferase [Phycicoccus sp. Soil748]|uniref:sulfotransferase family protein n=1 Tax=Phycicoccus sp. Soil748 TaxID=1736397 RepID=UPI00070362B4|nr:sulfotransferase [Phycicoccus sp. Soil748]KRE58812.1 hypothetical protein ASG70_16300 [Phycicoccus sp. Soil748]
MLALVTGTGRSGTTLVQETLSRHPATGFISGIDDKLPRLNLRGRHNGRLYRLGGQRPAGMRALAEGALFQRGRMRVAPSEGYQLFDRHVMSGFSTPCRDLLAEDMTPHLRPRVVDFFEHRKGAQGCDVMVQHLTGWPRVGFLREAVPDLKVVNVVRDGRAVASSWLQMGWWDGWKGPDKWIYGPLPADLQQEWVDHRRSFPVLAALAWKMLMAAYEDARALTPADQWLDVRYEDFLLDPVATCKQMLEFLGLDWSPEFQAGFERQQITSGRSQAYREELTPKQLADVEDVLAEPLARWGYSL